MKRIFGIVISALVGFAVGDYYIRRKAEKKYRLLRRDFEKCNEYYYVLKMMISNKQRRGTSTSFFADHGYTEVAIYGLGDLGHLFYNEANSLGLKIKYIIDRNKKIDIPGVPVYYLDDNLPDVQCLVVTPILETDQIEKALGKRINTDIRSLEEIIEWGC